MSSAVSRALAAMTDRPRSLQRSTGMMAELDGLPEPTEAEIVDTVTTSDLNHTDRLQFTLAISRWDSLKDAEWCGTTPAHSRERRQLIHHLLGLSDSAAARIDSVFPRDIAAIVIEDTPGDWTPWYTTERQQKRHFYWDAYRGVLERAGWEPEPLAKLDTATYDIVRRLADPTWEKPYQAKGLTVGYVQSGKTANFTGVLAKAIDAGYRLVIILTGTIELLRRQTQRRLDMELIGVENILGGIDENNVTQMEQTDYWGDADWNDGKFLRHGLPIHSHPDIPEITRLSSYSGDYRSLKQGLSALEFRGSHLQDPRKPLYDEDNLFVSPVRIAVVKKNSTVLQRLVEDLDKIHAKLGEIPTLIVDDEADQASVNTKRQKGSRTAAQKERTAINRHISDLLRTLPRAQYVGYTATPFANVFVDPDDSEDIFPKDFIVALERPAGYMGARDFHDLDLDVADTDKNYLNSNERRHVRDVFPLEAGQRRGEIQAGLDAFVLSAAIKMYRGSVTNKTFRHHTMLVHESNKQAEHKAVADEFREAWRTAGYGSPSAAQRLRELFDEDFRPVRDALVSNGIPEAEMVVPDDFLTLVTGGHLSAALDKIETGLSPVIIVNGDKDKDYEQDDLDFQKNDVWKILVGGTKLSRGFTVEGLTISFYTRRTEAADTLMQMGRWFGYRRGYRDLIRLFIAREVSAPRGKTVDLYEAFEAMVRDEEDFRDELRRFAREDPASGKPMVRPEDVPPFVFQRLPWLKPTAGNKMYNKKLVTRGAGGRTVDFPYLVERGDGSDNVRHLDLLRPVLEALTETGTFTDRSLTDPAAKATTYDADYGILPADLVIATLRGFRWADGWSIEPDLAFLVGLHAEGKVEDFAVLLPRLKDVAELAVAGAGRLPLLQRKRREDRAGFSGSSKRQRPAIETIAGLHYTLPGHDEPIRETGGGQTALDLHRPDRGALLLTFAYDPSPDRATDRDPRHLDAETVIAPRDVASLLSWAIPWAAAPRPVVGFQAIKSGGAIVPRD